ncbi:EF-P lysine aminoacylase GenX [Patescibacteria group bacterium]|nr:EF-P lysine aminoacylase GenX [Patescibacteria group bacterium]MBU1967068.1 EF-P lysine aminoacylase GenX [Patescibacteria group bacterium]
MKNWQKLKQKPDLWRQFFIREQVLDGIRSFFKHQNFHEVETPLLVASPGTEPYLDLFTTDITFQTPSGDKKKQLYLLTSPELAMKKLVAAGLPKIFQLCKSFRNNEGLSSLHNPEFTILEWYRANADYTDIMNDCENLIKSLVKNICQSDALPYQGKTYQLAGSWPRITIKKAFLKYAQIDSETLLNRDLLMKTALKKGYRHAKNASWEELYHQIFLNEIEPALATFYQPVFLCDYPLALAALSRKKANDERFAERFELYIGGIELANAFSELVDPTEQRQRATADIQQRQELSKDIFPIDEDYIQALESGLPPTGGIALGVDRLIMLLADVKSIQETLFFPIEEAIELE